NVVEPDQVGTVADKDLILLGTVSSQPLLSEWAGFMPLGLAQDRMWLNESSPPDRLLNPEWAFHDEDRNRLARLAASGRPADALVEAFVSPLRADRSVIAIVPATSAGHDAIASLFMPAVRQGAVYGSVAASRDGRFQSFLVGI